MTDPTLAGSALSAAISALIDSVVRPAVKRLLKTKAEGLPSNSAQRSDAIMSGYVERTYQRLTYIHTLALQDQRRELLDLYVPLTVQSSRQEVRFQLDRYLPAFLPRYKRVLLTDAAGMGKSTLLKFLYLSSVHHCAGLPLFVELRKLSRQASLIEYLTAELSPTADPSERELILQLLRSGAFIFLLDGYDEIPLADRDSVAGDLQQFIARSSESVVLVSSRPETSLGIFADFHQFNIVGLTLDEAFALLRKYDKTGDVASAIVGKLTGPVLSGIRDFLTNPLLVSLLFKSYEYKPTIPIRKHIFYRQVYDALFESHDLTKGAGYVREKLTGLDIEQFHTVMRALGFVTLGAGKVAFDRDELLSLIRDAREKSTALSFREADLLTDLLSTVPLFAKDGTLVRWNHKSLQDYFSAQFICQDTKARQLEVMTRMYKSVNCLRYLNLLDLCYDIDLRAFRQSVVRELLREMIDHCRSTFGNFKWELQERDLKFRREISFARAFLYVPPRLLKRPRKGAAPTFSVFFDKIARLRLLPNLHRAYLIRFKDKSGVVVAEGPEWEVIDLLIHKGDIACMPQKSVLDSDLSRVLPGGLSKIAGKEMAPIDDRPNSPQNSAEAFPEVCQTLNRINLPRIDLAMAIELARVIDQEKARDAGDNNGLYDFI